MAQISKSAENAAGRTESVPDAPGCIGAIAAEKQTFTCHLRIRRFGPRSAAAPGSAELRLIQNFLRNRLIFLTYIA